MSNFYLTTPIYYPNARPHVGSAYTTIVCDVLARYKRMCGYDVAFLTGTDEHGEKLQRAADAAGVPVARFVSQKRELFRDLWRKLGIPEYNPERPSEYGYRFVHTSQNPDHVASVHWMIRHAQKAGYIDKKKYEGRYCISDERYVSDGPEPADCDICGRPAELISEENYFFKLSAFGPSEPGGDDGRLLQLYRDHPKFVQPDFRRNEVISFVKGGLRDISISRRRLKWGVPWPGDSEQVVYVWYDALTSYLTGIGFAGDSRPPSKDFEKYWMGRDGPSEVVHMIGKDILRFHAVYWPAFLMAANDALPAAEHLPLPRTIFAHGWIYYEQDKMSKSKGNVVYPEPIVDALNALTAPIAGSPTGNASDVGAPLAAPDTVGALLAAPRSGQSPPLPGPGNDALRYYLLREAPFGHDTSFSYEALIQRYNSDLANDLGNLASRTLTMLHQFCASEVPSRPAPAIDNPFWDIQVDYDGIPPYFDRFDFSGALGLVGLRVSAENKRINDAKPWLLAKSSSTRDREILERTLYERADFLRAICVLLGSVMPSSMRRLWKQLSSEEYPGDLKPGDLKPKGIDQLEWGGLKPGTKVGRPEPIFPRLDKAKTLAKLEELAEVDRERDSPKGATVPPEEPAINGQPSAVSQPSGVSPQPSAATGSQQPTTSKITIDDFAKVELVVGQILSAEPIPKAQKLLKLQVDIGSETRQVCAGIAEYYKPEDLAGMKIVLVANLEPRKLRGVESNGMVVAASIGPEGRPVLATFKEDVPNGTRLK
jgi:methionyl-tRNA synthetase